jgi:hypothetical protein
LIARYCLIMGVDLGGFIERPGGEALSGSGLNGS